MENKELLNQIEEKRQELTQLIIEHGFTSELVLTTEHEFDRLIVLHLHQFLEAQGSA